MGGLRGPARGWTVNIRATGEIWSGVVATFNTVPAGWGMLAGAGDLDFPVRGGADSHRYGLIFSIDEGATWAYAGANHTFTLPPGDPVPRRVCLAVNRPHLDETAAGTGAWAVTITGSVPDAGTSR